MKTIYVDFWSCLGQQTKRYTKTTSACFTKPIETGALWPVQRSTFRRARMCVYVRCVCMKRFYWGKVDWNNKNSIDYASTTHAHNRTHQPTATHTRTHTPHTPNGTRTAVRTHTQRNQKDGQRANERARERRTHTSKAADCGTLFWILWKHTMFTFTGICTATRAAMGLLVEGALIYPAAIHRHWLTCN